MTADVLEIPALPALVVGHVEHERRHPIRHRFRHGRHLWLVDLDRLPVLPRWLRPLAGFQAGDHVGGGAPGASRSIRDNLESFLRGRGVDTRATDRFVMLTGARVLGYVFNPLSVFWCVRSDSTVRCIVAEVHNTYGERHAYVIPGPGTSARIAKELYVSPFNDVSGEYRCVFALDHERVRVAISLARGGRHVFGGSFTGVPRPATHAAVLRTFVRRPFMPFQVAGLIRIHGGWLWARRLPVLPRPPHSREDASP